MPLCPQDYLGIYGHLSVHTASKGHTDISVFERLPGDIHTSHCSVLPDDIGDIRTSHHTKNFRETLGNGRGRDRQREQWTEAAIGSLSDG